MITKFTIGQTQILTKDFRVLPSPGVGSIEFSLCDSLWTGSCHIYPSSWKDNIKLTTHIGFIASVETRSSLDEDDEEWKIHFTREKDRLFTYEYEAGLTKIIEELSKIKD